MNRHVAPEDFGSITEPATLTIQRLLPGPIERVWSYLTDSDLRRKWLAGGDMDPTAGSHFTLTWRNDELTNPPGQRPDGFGPEHSLESRVVEATAPHKLVFTWGPGEVSFELSPAGQKVLLTLVHRRISDRKNMVMIGAGWHMHLDILAARMSGAPDPEPFWDGWGKLRRVYESRVPA